MLEKRWNLNAHTIVVFSVDISCFSSFFVVVVFFVSQHGSRLSLRPSKKDGLQKCPKFKTNSFPTTKNKAYFGDFSLKWKRCRYDRDNSFCTFWEKLPALMALCLLFFKHSGIARLLSLLVSKIDKIRNCFTFFQKYAALITVF